MNPQTIFRFTCTKKRRNSQRECGNVFDVPAERRAEAWDIAIARGWESQGADHWICDSCACVLTLCPVCRETKFRIGIDGTCSAFCAARKASALIDNDADTIIAALVEKLDA